MIIITWHRTHGEQYRQDKTVSPKNAEYKTAFVSTIPRRNLEMPQDWLHATSIEKNKLFTGNGPSKTQEKQRRDHISNQKNNEILNLKFTPEKWVHLHQFVVMITHLNEKGPIRDATRNPQQDFRDVAKESVRDMPTRNPNQEFRNLARNAAARDPNQALRNVAIVVPAIKYAGKYAEKGNETLCAKNESERMSVVTFHDVDVIHEARDNERLTPKKNKGKETLHFKGDKKETLASTEIKGKVRELE